MTSITIADGVTSIGVQAFIENSSLATISIPRSITNIGNLAFNDCPSLVGITVDEQNPWFSSLNGVLFDKPQTALIQYPTGSAVGNYSIPSTVTNIVTHAFSFCTMLTNVVIPEGVITNSPSAFLSSTRLATVALPADVTSIEGGAFELCYSLGSIIIPASVTNLGIYAFAGTGLGNVTIPGNVANIPYGAFEGCTGMTNAAICNGVTTIGEFAFDNCLSLTKVTIAASLTNIGTWAFWSCSNLSTVFFKGNAPTTDPAGFESDNATAYYLSGTTGWEPTLAGLPTVLWNPQIQTAINFGVQNEQFGFDITATNNIPVLVEATTNLISPVWTPLQTSTITNGLFHFTEPFQANSAGRFYRLSPL